MTRHTLDWLSDSLPSVDNQTKGDLSDGAEVVARFCECAPIDLLPCPLGTPWVFMLPGILCFRCNKLLPLPASPSALAAKLGTDLADGAATSHSVNVLSSPTTMAWRTGDDEQTDG